MAISRDVYPPLVKLPFLSFDHFFSALPCGSSGLDVFTYPPIVFGFDFWTTLSASKLEFLSQSQFFLAAGVTGLTYIHSSADSIAFFQRFPFSPPIYKSSPSS